MSLRRHATAPGPEHNVIQAPELIRRLRERLGLRQAHVSPALTEGITAVVIADDLREGQFSAVDVRPCLGTVAITAPAGFPSKVWLANPFGSGVTVRVRRIQVYEQTLALATHLNQIKLEATGQFIGATPGNVQFADLRENLPNPRDTVKTSQPKAQLSADSTIVGAITATMVIPAIPALYPPVYELDNVVLPEQTTLWIQQGVNAAQLRVNLWWDELAAKP